MRVIFAICQKEWRISADTVQGYIVSIAFFIISGMFFANDLFLNGQADMRHWFVTLPLLFIFFIPAMSMRLFADELRDGTYALLTTMPTQTSDIVWGKYLSVLGQISLLLFLTMMYPLTLALLGDIDVGLIAASYFATWLLSATVAAICLYASSLTRYAIVAYMVSVLLLLLLFFMGQFALGLGPLAQDLVRWLDFMARFQHMLRGIVGLDDVMLFVTYTALFLSLCWFQLERRRWR